MTCCPYLIHLAFHEDLEIVYSCGKFGHVYALDFFVQGISGNRGLVVNDKSKFDILFVILHDFVEVVFVSIYVVFVSAQEPRNFELEVVIRAFSFVDLKRFCYLKRKLNKSIHHWQFLGLPECQMWLQNSSYSTTPPHSALHKQRVSYKN